MTQIGVRYRLIFFNPKRQIRVPIFDDRKNSSIVQLKKMDRRKSQNEKISKYSKNGKKALLCLSSRLFKIIRGQMRLHAFRCIHLVRHCIEYTRNYQETSIRTILSEDLNLRIEILGLFKIFKNQIRLFAFTRVYKVKNKYSKKYTWAHLEKTRKWLSVISSYPIGWGQSDVFLFKCNPLCNS